MLVARFLLGLGSEPMIVAITCALAKWFKGKELSFAFGINLTIARLGSVSADWSPTWVRLRLRRVAGPADGGCCHRSDLLSSPRIAYGALEGVARSDYGLGQAGETDKLVWSDSSASAESYWFVVLLCVTFYSAIFPFRGFSIKFFIEVVGLHAAVRRDSSTALCPSPR